MKIKLKDLSESNIEKMNRSLIENGLHFKDVGDFLTMASLKEWVDEINNGECEAQSHLKPKDGSPLTIEGIQRALNSWTEIGVFETDLYFGRTSDENMDKLLSFISKNMESFSKITDIDILVERAPSGSEFKSLLNINVAKPDPEPEKLPEKDRVTVWEEGGVATIKGMNDQDTIVLFAKVDSPTYMTKKEHVDPSYDGGIVKTPDGKPVILFPLRPLGDHNFLDMIIKECSSLYMRESIESILFKVYHVQFDEMTLRNEQERSECLKHAELLLTKDVVLSGDHKTLRIIKNANLEENMEAEPGVS